VISIQKSVLRTGLNPIEAAVLYKSISPPIAVTQRGHVRHATVAHNVEPSSLVEILSSPRESRQWDEQSAGPLAFDTFLVRAVSTPTGAMAVTELPQSVNPISGNASLSNARVGGLVAKRSTAIRLRREREGRGRSFEKADWWKGYLPGGDGM
jgi:hypothetical protein